MNTNQDFPLTNDLGHVSTEFVKQLRKMSVKIRAFQFNGSFLYSPFSKVACVLLVEPIVETFLTWTPFQVWMNNVPILHQNCVAAPQGRSSKMSHTLIHPNLKI